MKSSNQLVLLGLLSAVSAAAAAADDGAAQRVDTSKWKCEACKFESGLSGTLDAGVGSVSDKSAKFGEYNGLDKKGGYVIGDFALRSRAGDGMYWNIDAANLGLKSRSVELEGGRQGSYKMSLQYDELQHLISDSVRTPYAGVGGTSLTLPAGFPAATTAAMPLAATLQTVELGTQRKRVGLGASWIPAGGWEYAFDFRRDTKDGTKRTVGAFFVNTAQLVEPVAYVTDQLDASASYVTRKWQLKLAYYGSLFRNSNDAFSWQNPFTLPGFPGSGTGQRALPPDNQFHQVQASLGYQFSERTRASADIAVGRMTQNDSFLPSTINPTLAVPALPGTSPNAHAKTVNANLKLSSAVTDRLGLNAALIYNDRDNRTPQALYQAVSTDLFPGIPRTNMPYSLTQEKLKVGADYRFAARTRLSGGIDYETEHRTFEEIDHTHEDRVWAKITTRALEKMDLSLKFAHGDRRNSGYHPVPAIIPAENPLLRKYNLADRTRETVAARADIAVHERVNLGLGIETSADDYMGSTIGLRSGRDTNVNADVSVILAEATSLHVFANHQQIKSTQDGSATFSTPTWSNENKDTINFYGIGLKHTAIKDKLDIGADYGRTRSTGEISVYTGASFPPFPHTTTTRDSLKLYANYRLKDNLSLLASYWFERFDSKNWMLDDVAPDTIPNALSFGELAPRYNLNVLRLLLRYKF